MTRKLTRRSITALAVLVLGACTAIPGPPRQTVVSETRAEQYFVEGRLEESADAFELLAARAGGSVDQVYRAALIQLEAGQPEIAARVLARSLVSGQASVTPRLDWQYQAGVALAAGDTTVAGEWLNRLSNQDLPTLERLIYQGQKAQWHFQRDEPRLATSFLTRRELWLSGERAITHNHQKIWDGLRASDPAALQSALATTSDEVVRGWLELVVGTGRVLRSPRRLASAVQLWVERYPGHPGNAYFVPALSATEASSAGSLDQIAVLLPSSGRTAAVATAIRDGFMGAHLQRGDPERILRFYDVTTLGASDAYLRAVNDGADLVVGPLTKPAIRELLANESLPVPVLALNRVTDLEILPPGFYQMALAPEDEAATAARRAVAAGRTRAIALAPFGDWGDRVLATFGETLTRYGGVLVDFERFESSETDFSHEIERVMQLQASIERRRRMRALVDQNLQYEPRRRQDVDVIFIAASVANARALKPQLKFHYSGDIPVYATSTAVQTGGERVNDLRDIEVAEIPWLIAPDSAPAPTLETFRNFWPSQQSLNRLNALGIDAYDVASRLFSEDFEDSVPISGATGLLTVGVDGIVIRDLPWARFDGQSIEALAPLEQLPEPSAEPELLPWLGTDEPAANE